jgi:hypothetical protein
MKSIRTLLFLVASAACIISCSLRYEDIAGEYQMHYNYYFSGSGFTGNTYNATTAITITQTDDIISVGGTPGTIDRDGNITITGDFLTDGTQIFSGSVDKSTGVISGTLSGSAEIDLWVGYYYSTFTVTITSGTLTLTPQ